MTGTVLNGIVKVNDVRALGHLLNYPFIFHYFHFVLYICVECGNTDVEDAEEGEIDPGVPQAGGSRSGGRSMRRLFGEFRLEGVRARHGLLARLPQVRLRRYCQAQPHPILQGHH